MTKNKAKKKQTNKQQKQTNQTNKQTKHKHKNKETNKTKQNNTVGTLVVTDFSKAFDCIDHTLAIKRLYELGTRCEILPWVAHFLTGRRQRVPYQSALSEWKTLSYEVSQSIKLGRRAITFIVVISSASEDSATKSFKHVDNLSLGEVRLVRMFTTWMLGQKTTTSARWRRFA